MSELRIGLGVDAHAFSDGVPLVLGGVAIESPRGLAGHSDGDVIAHALIDALLGGAGLGDIGSLFPPGEAEWEGASSLDLLRRAAAQVREAGWELVNADCVLIGEEPRIAPLREQMRERLAEAVGVSAERINVRATTTDKLGFTGRGQGLAAQAVAFSSSRQADEPGLDRDETVALQRGHGVGVEIGAGRAGQQRGAASPRGAGGTSLRSAPACATARSGGRREGQSEASGHTPQRGTRARQTVAPRSISACEQRASNASPVRSRTRATFVSTGRTSRPKAKRADRVGRVAARRRAAPSGRRASRAAAICPAARCRLSARR